MAGRATPIPVPVILAAIAGDEAALAAVVGHYRGYIRVLATRPFKDAYGNSTLRVDEDMRLRLESKLIHSILTGFKILPGNASHRETHFPPQKQEDKNAGQS